MADEVRTKEVYRDSEGRVIREEPVVRERHVEVKKGGGFGIGALIGLLIAVAAIALFAFSQGSFSQAGREADQATSQAGVGLNQAADKTGNAIENTGDRIENATDSAGK
jgi:hypothetical protein